MEEEMNTYYKNEILMDRDKSQMVLNNRLKSQRFRQANADKIRQSNVCEVCRGRYTYFNKSVHIKSKRHQLFMGIDRSNFLSLPVIQEQPSGVAV
jgi:hypothetical protein